MGIQKALAAAVMSVIALVAQFGVSMPETLTNADWVQAASVSLTPFIVWAIANK